MPAHIHTSLIRSNAIEDYIPGMRVGFLLMVYHDDSRDGEVGFLCWERFFFCFEGEAWGIFGILVGWFGW